MNINKKLIVKDLREFTYGNYYKQIGITKEDSYYSLRKFRKKDLLRYASKLRKKVSDNIMMIYDL